MCSSGSSVQKTWPAIWSITSHDSCLCEHTSDVLQCALVWPLRLYTCPNNASAQLDETEPWHVTSSKLAKLAHLIRWLCIGTMTAQGSMNRTYEEVGMHALPSCSLRAKVFTRVGSLCGPIPSSVSAFHCVCCSNAGKAVYWAGG